MSQDERKFHRNGRLLVIAGTLILVVAVVLIPEIVGVVS